jgi:protein-S-isoprenylcysteine O-methyltransferase Ste14
MVSAQQKRTADMARRFRRWAIGVGIISSLVMGVSGGWTDPWIRAYIGTWALVSGYALLRLDDDLAKERFTPPDPGADRLSLRAVRLIALAHLVVGALDAGRWHLTFVPAGLRVAGFLGMAISCMVVFHAMLSNRFFSPVVRIQTDRGHRLVDTGPYNVVRHPGYAGMILMAPFSGLALGSWIGVAIGLVYSALIVRRVFFEDDFLRRNLEGYDAYTQRVRYRLLPGVF